MESHSQNNLDIPPELCSKTLCLIGFSGLDTLNNAIHKTIWDAFSNSRRIENAPVHYKLFGNAHEFPTIKPKRSSYDWYIPRGILKRNWMNKHLKEIPAVMVIFYDLDWDEPLWNEKVIECVSRVQSLRAALEGRGTKIVVVLIQNTVPLPHGEDVMAAERALHLCTSCEFSSQSLFVLPHGDHLLGYVTRLEMAFYEFALNYYHSEIKNIRSHKEHLDKNSHLYLLIRHQFKLGFLYEMRQDKNTALKHYGSAYNHLLEVRIVDTNALEIRTVSGFINYKLCRLMFLLHLPRDAISQFKAHVERFKNRIGFQELSFEHYAWLSKQYSIFGDIFDEAVKQGLPGVQTQNPGIYYQQAAQYAILRKKTSKEICSKVLNYPTPDPLEGIESLEFYGQRPWRSGKLTSENQDPHLEAKGIQALQYLENQFSHSTLIISLFGLAISQYKTFRCPRTRRHLILQMAEEYYNAFDFCKALTLLMHMLSDFRTENWWFLITNILDKALDCAYLSANIQDYILLSLEILGKNSTLELRKRKTVNDNLLRILQKIMPVVEQNVPPEILSNVTDQWEKHLHSPNLSIPLDITNISSCIEVKVRFKKNKYEVDETILLEIFIKCTNHFSMKFNNISCLLISPNNTWDISVSEKPIHFKYNEVKKFEIQLSPHIKDVNQEIRVNGINLQIGDPSILCCNLKIENFTNNGFINKELLHFKKSLDPYNFDNIPVEPICSILPRHSRLCMNVEHAIPALVDEWFLVKIHLLNEENDCIKDLKMIINIEDYTNSSKLCLKPNESGEKLPLSLDIAQSLESQSKISTEFYIKSSQIVENIVDIKISYTLNIGSPVISIKNEKIVIPVVKPFELNVKYLSSVMTEITTFYVGEEFCVMPILTNLSIWPIIIESTSIEFKEPFVQTEEKGNRINNIILTNKEMNAEVFSAICQRKVENYNHIAKYNINWKRENSSTTTTTQLLIMGCPCESIALEISSSLPAHGVVRTPLYVNYHISNRLHQSLHLEINMEGSEAFMYSGYKQSNITILPEKKETIKYIFYPLIAGKVVLPKLNFNIPENSVNDVAVTQDQLKMLINRSIPSHVYIMPQSKGHPPPTEAAKPKSLSNFN